MDKCGSCKCYICGYSHCGRSLCRGEQKSTCQFSKKGCGKFVFDAEKLRDKLIPEKESKDGSNNN